MDRSRRILFLLLINLGLVFVSLYILDYLQVIDYHQILNRVSFLKRSSPPKVEDPFLLERVELEKKWEVLKEKQRTLKQQQDNLAKEKRKIEEEKIALEKKRKDIDNQISLWKKQKESLNTYDKKVDDIAKKLVGMRPDAAVEILSKQDDLFIIDILHRIDKNAEAEGSSSLSPYYLQLLQKKNPDQAGRIVQKMGE